MFKKLSKHIEAVKMDPIWTPWSDDYNVQNNALNGINDRLDIT